MQAQLSRAQDLEVGGILIADRQPEGPGRLQHPDHALDPHARPGDVVVARPAVVVDVIVVANIERGVGEGQVDGFLGKACQPLDAVCIMYLVELHVSLHCVW